MGRVSFRLKVFAAVVLVIAAVLIACGSDDGVPAGTCDNPCDGGADVTLGDAQPDGGSARCEAFACEGGSADSGPRDATVTDGSASDAARDADAMTPDGGVVCPGEAGALDLSFGDGGMVWLKYPGGQAFAVAMQTDGKIVVAGGTAPRKFAVVRLLADGTVDPTFGTLGLVETTILPVDTDVFRGVVVQADGKIVAAGPAAGVGPRSYDFVVVRYNSDGGLDSTFGDAGAAVTDFGNTDDYPRSVALQPDGRIVVAGQSQTNAMTATTNFTVARYNTDGSLDTTFGSGGRVTIDVQGTPDVGGYLSILPSGKIMLAGASGTTTNGSPYEISAVRLNSDGTLDTTFANAGKMVTTFGGAGAGAGGITIDALGRPVLGGSLGSYFATFRLEPSGALDPSFGDGGAVVTDLGSGRNGYAGPVHVQQDGKALAVGGGGIGAQTSTYGIALARLQPNGDADPSFGTGGKAFLLSPTDTYLTASAASPTTCGVLVVGTWGYDNTSIPKNAMGIARFRR